MYTVFLKYFSIYIYKKKINTNPQKIKEEGEPKDHIKVALRLFMNTMPSKYHAIKSFTQKHF